MSPTKRHRNSTPAVAAGLASDDASAVLEGEAAAPSGGKDVAPLHGRAAAPPSQSPFQDVGCADSSVVEGRRRVAVF